MHKPWNIPNLPVYSLATYSNERKVNMNICTYVSAISMQPKFYAIAIYENTQTLENILVNPIAVLQLLHPTHISLVKKLGKISGLDFDKHKFLQEKGYLTCWEGLCVLKNTSARVLIKKETSLQTGDHYLHVFRTLKYQSYTAEYLDTQTLRDKRIIRA